LTDSLGSSIPPRLYPEWCDDADGFSFQPQASVSQADNLLTLTPSAGFKFIAGITGPGIPTTCAFHPIASDVFQFPRGGVYLILELFAIFRLGGSRPKVKGAIDIDTASV